MATKDKDITKTGPQSYRDLQKQNDNDIRNSDEYKEATKRLLEKMAPIPSAYNPSLAQSTYHQSSVLQNNPDAEDYFGNSMFDKEGLTANEFDNIGNIRAEEQPWYAKVGAGIAKGAILTGTTFLDGTVGLITGLATGFANLADDDPNTGFWNGLWNNPFSKAMQGVTEWSEKVMPNYYSNRELEDPWYEHIFSANFIGDKFIKNLGFSIGALYSGGVAAKATAPLSKLIAGISKSTGAEAMTASVIGGFVSALNEGRVEAINNSKDWFEGEKRKLDDYYESKIAKEFKPLFEAATEELKNTRGNLVKGPDGQMYDPAVIKYNETIAKLEQEMGKRKEAKYQDAEYNRTLAKLAEDRLGMGTMDMLMNLPILTVSNLTQFARFYSRGFDTGRRVSTNMIKGPMGGVLAATKGALAEGTEEITQAMASRVSGKYYQKDIEWFKKGIEPSAEQRVQDFIKANVEGISETLGEGSAWEEFFIGSLTGALGIPKFRGLKNKAGQWQSPITLEGGAVNHYREHMEKVGRLQKIEDYMNHRISTGDIVKYYRGLIRDEALDADMEAALEAGDKFDFENAAHAKLISDIVMFDSVGKLGELRAHIDNAFDTSDENLIAIVQNTTTGNNGNLNGPFAEFAARNEDGTIRVELENGGREKIIEALTKKRDEIFKAIDNYKKHKNNIDIQTGGRLSDEQLGEITWMQTQLDNWDDRMGNMGNDIHEILKKLRVNLETRKLEAEKSYKQAYLEFNDLKENDIANEQAISESSTKVDKARKLAESLTKRIDSLEELAQADPKKVGAILSNPVNKNFTTSLLIDLMALKSDSMDNESRIKALDLINDLVRLGEAKESLAKKLDEYLADPEKIAEDHARATQEVQEEIQETKKKSLRDKIESAKSTQEIRDIIDKEEDKDIVNKTLDELEKSEDAVLKAKVRDYKETTQYDNEVRKALESLGESKQVVEDALNIWGKQVGKAVNLAQIARPDSFVINNEGILTPEGDLTQEELDAYGNRFQLARYALQRAMNKVNNDIKFKDRFSPEYKIAPNQPILKTVTDTTTGDSGTSTVPAVNDSTDNKGTVDNTKDSTQEKTSTDDLKVPVGDVKVDDVKTENKELNESIPEDNKTEGTDTKKYYKPQIPELHIEASKEGDFREFWKVVKEREGKDYQRIYEYLEKSGAFEYLNSGKLKAGDEIGFMIDPAFEAEMSQYDWYTGPTIFFVHGTQVLGDVASFSQAYKFENLIKLVNEITEEYQISTSTKTQEKFEKFEDVALVTLVDTKAEKSQSTPVQEWSKDIDNANAWDTGWGEHEGLTWFYISEEGLDIYLWIKVPITEKGKEQIEELIIQDEGSETLLEDLLEIINNNQIARQSSESETADTVEESPVALSALLKNGKGTVETASDFLQAVAEAFPDIKQTIEELNAMVESETLSMKPDDFAKSGHDIISMLAGLITEYYGEAGTKIYQEFLNNSTGFVPSVGAKVAEEINKLTPIKEVEQASDSEQSTPSDNTSDTSPSPATTDKFYSSKKTKVSKMMVGKVPYSTEERSLNDIPGVKEDDRTSEPVFGIIKNGMLVTNGKVSDSLVLKPQDMANKEGRLYLLIPNGAGTYSPVAVRVKHFNAQEFDVNNPTVAATVIGEEILKGITALSEATSKDEVTEAMKSLVSLIYLRDVHINYFEAAAGSGITISINKKNADGSYVLREDGLIEEDKHNIYFQNSKKVIELNGLEYDIETIKLGIEQGTFPASILNDFGTPKPQEEIIKEILDTLFSFNLPLQVNARTVNNEGYNDRLISSNVLTSNLTEATTKGTWFTTDYVDADGNIQPAENPKSKENTTPASKPATITPPTTISPVGGTETVGTKVTIGNTTFIVNIKNNTFIDANGQTQSMNNHNKAVFAMAWAQEKYGDITEAPDMIDNKIITPQGNVLDRNTGAFLSEAEAKEVKDRIAERDNKDLQVQRKQAEDTIANIEENQKKVDKTRTDSESYYILEEDGEYHAYDRVHTRLGDNWTGKRTSSENSKKALAAGSAVDQVIRDFFNGKTVTKPDNLSDTAFNTLLEELKKVKASIDARGERFLANNIVLFHKYADGTRVAGEVDILAVDKNGNFKIYDVKTSKYSFESKNFTTKSAKQVMSTKDYYTLQLSAYQNLFESQYGIKPKSLAIIPFLLTYEGSKVATLQKQAGIPITYNDKVNVPLETSEQTEPPIADDTKHAVAEAPAQTDEKAETPSSTSPATDSQAAPAEQSDDKVKTDNKTETPDSQESSPSTDVSNDTDTSTVEPIFNQALENEKYEDKTTHFNAFEEEDTIGYYIIDEKLHKGHIRRVGEVEVDGEKFPIFITKETVTTRGFGKAEEHAVFATFYVVFKNGKALPIIKDAPLVGDDIYSDSKAAETIYNLISKNPNRVKSESTEETLINQKKVNNSTKGTSDIEVADSTISTTSNVDTSIAEAVEREQRVNDIDDEFEDVLELRQTDSKRELWDKEKELAWLQKVLPQVPVKTIETLIEVANKGITAWGMFHKGVITLSDLAAEGTAYHEAFHAVFDTMLTSKEREDILNEARKKWGNVSYSDTMELLAEDFREYVMNQENKGWGRKILDFFKNLLNFIRNKGKVRNLTYYYNAINNGKFADRPMTSMSEMDKARLGGEEYTSEMQDIKDKAIADGTFMKAPNGNPTNLNERQWLQVRTKAFKDWFGDWINNPAEASKVVDENGEPLVVYHHRKNEINNFSKRIDNVFPGIYFSVKPYIWFGNYQVSAFLNLKNPIKESVEITTEMFEDNYNWHINKGYDGAIGVLEDVDPEEAHLEGEVREIVAFYPNQIKSATTNTGEFSTENDDIRYRTVDNNTSWESLNNDDREILAKKGWTEEHFNRISQVERDQAIECAGL